MGYNVFEPVFQADYSANGRKTTTIDALKNKCRVIGLIIEFFGTVTAAGGGAVSGLLLDAPLSLLTMTIKRGTKVFVEGRLSDLYRTMAGLTGYLSTRTAATPGAGATGNIRGVVFLSLQNEGPYSIPTIAGWDLRDGRDVYIDLKFGALTDYATTNVSAIAATFRITAMTEIDNWKEPADMLLFQPVYAGIDVPQPAANRDLAQNLTPDQFLKSLHVMGIDTSLSGQSQMVDGLNRTLGVSLKNNDYRVGPTAPWRGIQSQGWRDARIVPADQQAGCAMIHFERKGMDTAEWLKLWGANGQVRLDSKSDVDGDVTGITASATTSTRLMQCALDVTPALWEMIRNGTYKPTMLHNPAINKR